jgi:hypothetical protein
VGLAGALVPVIDLSQDALMLVFVEVGRGLKNTARLGAVFEKSLVVLAGPIVLIHPGCRGLKRAQTPIIIVKG